MIQIDHPTGLGSEYFQYEDVGNLEAKRDGNDDVTAYEYDSLNRLVAVKYGYGSNAWPAVITGSLSNPDVTYSYYGGSRLRHEMADSVGTSHYDYDIQDRLTSYTPPAPEGHGAITYAYNALGQKTSVSGTGVGTVNYGYYANGWLKKVSDGTTDFAVYAYDSAGNRTGITLGNDATTAYAYDSDPRYRMSSITHTPVGQSAVTITYPMRDSAGNPRRMVIGAAQTDYDYDANSRLTVENSTSFAYDWVGNRLNPPADPNPMVYNAADQLVTWPNQHQYTYLGMGSLYQQKDSQGTVQKTFSYTAANLLLSVVHAGIGTSSMTWDADSNRVSFTSSTGGTWSFVYDVTAGIPAVVEETGPVYYVREPSGSLIARIDGETVRYYHFDALGSTRLLTSASGAVTDTYSYDAWGSVSHESGSVDQPYQFVGQLGYYTHVQDENLPLLQLGVRFYDPETGRFTQVDPVRHGRNWYVYAKDRPVNATDPTGLFCWHIGGECFGTTCAGDPRCPPRCPPQSPPRTPPPAGPPAPPRTSPPPAPPVPVPGPVWPPPIGEFRLKYGFCKDVCMLQGGSPAMCEGICTGLTNSTCDTMMRICEGMPYPRNEQCGKIFVYLCIDEVGQ